VIARLQSLAALADGLSAVTPIHRIAIRRWHFLSSSRNRHSSLPAPQQQWPVHLNQRTSRWHRNSNGRFTSINGHYVGEFTGAADRPWQLCGGDACVGKRTTDPLYCTRIDSKPFGYDGTAFARLVDNLANIDSMLPCSRCPHRSISRDQRGNCQITATIAMYRSGTHLETRGFRVSNRALCSR
jgi:hypothetical protein